MDGVFLEQCLPVKNERQFGPLVRLNFVFNGPMVWLLGEFGCNVAIYRWLTAQLSSRFLYFQQDYI